MDYRKVLNGLFIFEVVIGALLTGYGVLSLSPFLILIGLSVVGAHVAERVLLNKVA